MILICNTSLWFQYGRTTTRAGIVMILTATMTRMTRRLLQSTQTGCKVSPNTRERSAGMNGGSIIGTVVDMMTMTTSEYRFFICVCRAYSLTYWWYSVVNESQLNSSRHFRDSMTSDQNLDLILDSLSIYDSKVSAVKQIRHCTIGH